jgi:hypothetical protein
VLKALQLRRWWWLHVLATAAILVQLRLGLWQLHRVESPTGAIYNYAYAVQWPLFAVFTAVLWIRTLREEAHRAAGEPIARELRRPMPDEPADVWESEGVRIGITTELPPVDTDDEEVTTYNAYLARLSARAAR